MFDVVHDVKRVESGSSFRPMGETSTASCFSLATTRRGCPPTSIPLDEIGSTSAQRGRDQLVSGSDVGVIPFPAPTQVVNPLFQELRSDCRSVKAPAIFGVVDSRVRGTEGQRTCMFIDPVTAASGQRCCVLTCICVPAREERLSRHLVPGPHGASSRNRPAARQRSRRENTLTQPLMYLNVLFAVRMPRAMWGWRRTAQSRPLHGGPARRAATAWSGMRRSRTVDDRRLLALSRVFRRAVA
jgi:hypothetical protein